MSRLALGRSNTGPALWFMDLDTGRAVPVPTALDNGGAFYPGLGRRGWTAVKVQYQVGAILDGGDVRQPVLLPEAWHIYPAATDDLLLIRRYFGRSAVLGEHTQVLVAGPDGQVHRSMTLPFPFIDQHGHPDDVVGEVDAGVVTARGIVGWDCQVTPLPFEITGDWATDPRLIGVLAGRVIVFQHGDAIGSVDLTTGARHHLEIPVGQRTIRTPDPQTGAPPPLAQANFEHLVQHSASGNWLTSYSTGRNYDDGFTREPARLLAGPRGELRWLPATSSATWFEDRLLLQVYDRTTYKLTSAAIEYDPARDTKTPVTLPPPRLRAKPSACVGVTGRLTNPMGG
jgi:hypothetical protein